MPKVKSLPLQKLENLPVLPLKYHKLVLTYIDYLKQGKLLNNTSLAKELKITEGQIQSWLRDERVRAYLNAYLEDTRQKAIDQLNAEIPKNIATIVEIRNTSEDHLRLKASQDLLDRAGVSSKPTVAIQNNYLVNLSKFFNEVTDAE